MTSCGRIVGEALSAIRSPVSKVKIEWDSDTATNFPLGISEVVSIASFLLALAPQSLYLSNLKVNNEEAGDCMTRALVRLKISKLAMNGPGCTGVLHLDILQAIKNQNLRALRLDRLNFESLESVREFSRAMSISRLDSLQCWTLFCAREAEEELGRALCQPSVQELMILSTNSKDALYLAISRHLIKCPRLRILRLGRPFMGPLSHPFIDIDETTLVSFLVNCRLCQDLSELALPRTTRWSKELDLQTAQTLTACRRLLKVTIEVQVGVDSPALLAACRKHSVIEEIELMPQHGWPRELVLDLKYITRRNKETSVHRKRYQALVDKKVGLGVVSRALYRVSRKPHLTYLLLSVNRHCFT